MRSVFLLTVGLLPVSAQDFVPQRCEVLPLPNHQAQFLIDGVEKTRWHFGRQYPGPFLYPLNGPSGVSLTRMGHPGASNHDHHRSVWIAFHKLNDLNFWAEGTGNQIRQKYWYRYRDGQDEAVMAACLGWYDAEQQEVMEQDVVIAVRPGANGESEVEFQLTMRPGADRETVTLNQTNFGLLAVRVSRTLSAHFGGGKLTNSEGAEDEPNIFGKPARWVDYSGPVVSGRGAARKVSTEGITFIDHPQNPGYPNHWHVREDGWVGASLCMKRGYQIGSDAPMTIRYLLHVHAGPGDAARSAKVVSEFASRPGFTVRRGKSGEKHLQFETYRTIRKPPE